ncbi:ATP-citrate synthase beta chain protein 1 [Coccomyxa sp. Obi]|nr:ATP-citrate synthase beta chain protein 1 [Coccomyxa sp. Obi]
MGSFGQIFSKDTQAIFYNWKANPVQRMLDFDFLCGRSIPSVACVVQPGNPGGFQKVFFGREEVAIPVSGSVPEAVKLHPKADVFINFASFRSAYESSMEAMKQSTIRVVAVIAEGVPEADTKKLIAYARANNKILIGPATVGGVQAGAFRIGDTAGTLDNIVACKLHRPGSVGFVSKSGGMSNEMYNVLSRTTDGLYEGIAIGGDVFPGSTLSDHCLRYENIPQIKLIVVLGELGGQDEYSLVAALKEGRIKKPVVAWVSGTCAKLFKSEVQFGHAGAKSGGQLESAQAKNSALKEAGAIVPDSFEALEGAVKQTYDKLVADGVLVPQPDVPAPSVPLDLEAAKKAGKVRVPTNIVSSICDDRGEEPTYNGVDMSTLIEGDYGVGDVISLLWFKRALPKYATRFIDMCVMLCADHGPCVSGAHNCIVTSRAGKDLVSCLVSGLLTIGPRFGGAIDDAARYFQDACDRGLDADEFVEDMKKKGIRVAGIGHRIKSKDNRDKRVELLQKYARKFFPSTRYLDYALTVERYTLTKAANLVLNVDGCIGALFLDLLHSSSMFSQVEIQDIVKIGYLNGLFVLARSIGLIGHALDQKRLQQPLYRHPWDEVLYTR